MAILMERLLIFSNPSFVYLTFTFLQQAIGHLQLNWQALDCTIQRLISCWTS